MKLKAFGSSAVGRVRARNEDSLLVRAELGVFAVADGMGGHAAGDVASSTAINEVTAILDVADEAVMLGAFERANRAVWERGIKDSDKAGMGSTLTAIAFAKNLRSCVIGHVGDSRLYRMRRDTLEQLTVDHTVAANVLSRAIGTQPDVDVDILHHDVIPNDRFLLCSDGLTNMVSNSDLRAVLIQDLELEQIAARLIEAANLRGGIDNITAVVIAVVS